MRKPTIRGLRLALVAVGLAGLFVAVNAVPGAATPASGVTGVPLARGTNMSVGTIPLHEGTDVVVVKNTFVAGGSSGWHSHPGGAIVVVTVGEITLYRSVGNHCDATRYIAGQAFIERPSDVQKGVNTGTVPAVVVVTFPSVPQDGKPTISLPDPHCP